MLALKMLLTVAAVLLFAVALGIPIYDTVLRLLRARRKAAVETRRRRPRTSTLRTIRLARTGRAGSRRLPAAARSRPASLWCPAAWAACASASSAARSPARSYAGTHFITPLVESVQMFDLRDHLFTAESLRKGAKTPAPKNGLSVQSREGLNIGLAVTVRYRLDPKPRQRPGPHAPACGQGAGPPVVASAWRELTPNYTVREIFSAASARKPRRKPPPSSPASSAPTAPPWKKSCSLTFNSPKSTPRVSKAFCSRNNRTIKWALKPTCSRSRSRIAELQAEAEAAQKVKQAEGDAQIQGR